MLLRTLRRLLQPINREDLTFIAVDTETTGLDPSTCAVTEVGWQIVHRGKLENASSAFVRMNPACLVDDNEVCKKNAERATNLQFDHIEPGLVRLRHCGEMLLRETGVRPHLVFHNAPFDVSFISTNSIDPVRWLFQEDAGPFSRRMFDTQVAVQPLVMRGQLKSQSLKAVCELLGVKPGNHTAAEDARATAECYIKLLTEGWV
jgi:DNA polymerase III epsilon subunit-like protein